MGPHYSKGETRIGRQRLSAGLVAILDDHAALCGAICELHEYATRNKSRERRGIVFRVVDAGERQAFTDKLIQVFGSKNLASQQQVYHYPVGHLHIIDDMLMAHASKRHSIETTVGHIAVTLDDYMLIPEIVNPRWISEFSFEKQMPRIIYERRYDHSTIVVVQEIQARAGLTVKTIYKKK